MSDIHQNKILILDFGSQYTQLIARRVREIGVYCELVPYDVNPHFIENYNPNGIILSGGPDTVSQIDSARAPNIVFDLKTLFSTNKTTSIDYYKYICNSLHITSNDMLYNELYNNLLIKDDYVRLKTLTKSDFLTEILYNEIKI